MAVAQLPKTTVTKPQEQAETRVATGEAAAAFLAGGIGCFIIGLMTTLAEVPALVDFKNALNWWSPAGPLTGKTGVGVIAFFLTWFVAHFAMREKEVNLKTYVVVAAVLTALGFMLTFPPFFELFAAE
ncbi:MAG TPA: hypothetical protein VFU22_30105 [Roseiflexaceae bacterium]|nr:hypothetical protein [Roseiflexaceae bacterium]